MVKCDRCRVATAPADEDLWGDFVYCPACSRVLWESYLDDEARAHRLRMKTSNSGYRRVDWRAARVRAEMEDTAKRRGRGE